MENIVIHLLSCLLIVFGFLSVLFFAHDICLKLSAESVPVPLFRGHTSTSKQEQRSACFALVFCWYGTRCSRGPGAYGSAWSSTLQQRCRFDPFDRQPSRNSLDRIIPSRISSQSKPWRVKTTVDRQPIDLLWSTYWSTGWFVRCDRFVVRSSIP